MRAKIAGAPQILDLLDFTPTFRAGTPQRVLVHHADVAAAIIEQVIFVIEKTAGDPRLQAGEECGILPFNIVRLGV